VRGGFERKEKETNIQNNLSKRKWVESRRQGKGDKPKGKGKRKEEWDKGKIDI